MVHQQTDQGDISSSESDVCSLEGDVCCSESNVHILGGDVHSSELKGLITVRRSQDETHSSVCDVFLLAD
jgi:hypothetical protein